MHESHSFRVSDFNRVRRLGTGCFGKTYLVQEKTTEAYYTVKSFPPTRVEGEALSDYLERLVAVSHPLLLQKRAYSLPNATKKHPLAVLSDYVGEFNLATFLEARPKISNLVKLNMIFAIAEGLRHIYSEGFAHRSLTCRSIFLTENTEVRISDYGYANIVGYSMPPFVTDYNETETENSLDCFCFGLIAWSILTGELWERRQVPKLDGRIHPSFNQLLSDCLDRDYLKRPKFETIVLKFLRSEFVLPLADGEVVKAREYRSNMVNPEFTRQCLIRALWQLRTISESNTRLREAITAACRTLDDSGLAAKIRRMRQATDSSTLFSDAEDSGSSRSDSMYPSREPSIDRRPAADGAQSRMTSVPRRIPQKNERKLAPIQEDDSDLEPFARAGRPQMAPSACADGTRRVSEPIPVIKAVTSSTNALLTAITEPSPRPGFDRRLVVTGLAAPNGGLEFRFETDPFLGIFAHLTEQAAGINVVTAGRVKITGNSTDDKRVLDIMNVVDFKWTGCWTSANAPNSWIAFDFAPSQVELYHYTIKTYHAKKGFSHMKSWKVEGCIPPGEWMLLDARNDTDDLNDRWAVQTFACTNHDAATVLRIVQTGPTHNNDNFLVLSNVEFFGIITPP